MPPVPAATGSTQTTSSPAVRNRRTKRRPTNPAPPVIKMRFIRNVSGRVRRLVRIVAAGTQKVRRDWGGKPARWANYVRNPDILASCRRQGRGGCAADRPKVYRRPRGHLWLGGSRTPKCRPFGRSWERESNLSKNC